MCVHVKQHVNFVSATREETKVVSVVNIEDR
jgi:hypothetical protein